MNILYVTDNLASSSVFSSQVHTVCNYHTNHGNVRVIAYCKRVDMRSAKPNGAKYEVIRVRRPPLLSIEPISWAVGLWPGLSSHFRWASIVHCRGHGPAGVALHCRRNYGIKVPIIADIRGAVPEEIRADGAAVWRRVAARLARNVEKLVFSDADYFFFVSQNMKAFYEDRYERKFDRSAITPTVIDPRFFHLMPPDRHRLRRELGFENSYVYVYSGGTDHWQNLDKILIAFDTITQDRDDLRLLMLVTNPSRVMSIMAENDIRNRWITVKSVEYRQVGKYLNACDAGLLIRDDSVVNKVAAPSKIGEYVACGLTIVDRIEGIGNLSFDSRRNSRRAKSVDAVGLQHARVYDALLGNASPATDQPIH